MTRKQFIKILLASTTGSILNKRIFPQNLNVPKEVIIIGAGISGIAAARRLVNAGFNVTILEGRNRIGGRIWTDKSMGSSIEMGAGFISNHTQDPITKIVDQFKLTEIPHKLEDIEQYDSKFNKIQNKDLFKIREHYKSFLKKLHSMNDSLAEGKSILTAKDLIISEMVMSESEKEALESMIVADLEIKYGTHLNNLALQYFNENGPSPDSFYTLELGLSEVINQLAKGLNIKLTHIVSKIEYEDKVKITTNQGEFTSDYVLVTVPLGVLKKKKIQFVPDLPEKKRLAIQNLGIGTINKIFLKFPQKFWLSDSFRFRASLQSPNNLNDFWSLNPSKETTILSTIVAGENAISVESKNKIQIGKECIQFFKKIYGNKIPSPLEIQVSKWNSDPFSLGTSSFLGINSKPENFSDLADSIQDKVFFAGEATNKEFPSSVQGAYLSGEREANRIIGLNKN